MFILGIESSCDETAAAVVADGQRVLSNVVATQHELHERYAGVVPEIASRAHLERILPVIETAIREADTTLDAIDAVAVGNRPGLIGSLLVGVSAAKSLAWSCGIPLIGVDHILAHLTAPALDDEPIAFPALGLVVSGGHTALFHLADADHATRLGQTRDDAIGEAYDKAATILELGYPGGPAVDRLAQTGNDRAHDFPVANLDRASFDVSYSGLKTALLYAVCGTPVGRGRHATFPRDASSLTEDARADFAASFQRAAIRAVERITRRALEHHDVHSLIIGGGVSANSRLRTVFQSVADDHEIALRIPPLSYCVDNAAMIAGEAARRFARGDFDDLTLPASPRRYDASPSR
ncbi:MAG: tRNA (adenosine(37)-N6)-threonylcarbamoyltransferase complex transferase subunit TsaD [Planctomycetota bacterium]